MNNRIICVYGLAYNSEDIVSELQQYLNILNINERDHLQIIPIEQCYGTECRGYPILSCPLSSDPIRDRYIMTLCGYQP